MRVPVVFHLSTLIAGVAIAVTPAWAQFSSYTITSSPMKIDTTTTVPGASLKPGSYTIRVIDNLKDRYILAVADEHSKDLATFIGMLERDPLSGQIATGPVLWENAPGKTNALRGFSFPNGQTFEFVYPKSTAVELAKINASSVPAIDPESEGMPVDPKLSPEDRRVVTLWMLTSTRIGPGKGVPAIEARRAMPKASTEVAQVWDPLPAANTKSAAPPAAQSTKPESPNVALASTRPGAKSKSNAVAATLPQTGSDLPVVLLFSTVLLAAGFGVSFGRRMLSRA